MMTRLCCFFQTPPRELWKWFFSHLPIFFQRIPLWCHCRPQPRSCMGSSSAMNAGEKYRCYNDLIVTKGVIGEKAYRLMNFHFVLSCRFPYSPLLVSFTIFRTSSATPSPPAEAHDHRSVWRIWPRVTAEREVLPNTSSAVSRGFLLQCCGGSLLPWHLWLALYSDFCRNSDGSRKSSDRSLSHKHVSPLPSCNFVGVVFILIAFTCLKPVGAVLSYELSLALLVAVLIPFFCRKLPALVLLQLFKKSRNWLQKCSLWSSVATSKDSNFHFSFVGTVLEV